MPTAPAPTLAAGSVGTVETRYLDLTIPVRLDCGRELDQVRVACRYCVVATNLLSGCRGTTGPSSLDPATGVPYGSDFPVITVADIVRTERAFLDELGIERLAAVAGGSLGGMQAFERAITFPDVRRFLGEGP